MTSRPMGGFKVGQMRHRITLQVATESVDTSGQTIRTWAADLFKEPAQWIPTSGGETIRGKQIEAGINAVFIVRYRNDKYTPLKRISFDDRTYGIVHVKDIDGLRRYTQLECKAVDNG